MSTVAADDLELQLLRDLSSEQRAQLTAIVLGAASYSLACEGRLPCADDVEDILVALPPNCMPEAKFVFGVYRGTQMVGCADVIRGWPNATQCHIGLLLLAEPYQRKGYGGRAVAQIERVAREWPEIGSLRIAVVESNSAAFPFWSAVGFTATGQRTKSPHFIADLLIFEKPLTRVRA